MAELDFHDFRAAIVWIGDRVAVPEHGVAGVVTAAMAPESDAGEARFLVATAEPEPRNLWLRRDRVEKIGDRRAR